MQKCESCGKEIRFIPSGKSIIKCDAEETVIYNEFGRKIKGHKVHYCIQEGEKDGRALQGQAD